jgi:RNA polymerase sigma-70 factor (ECF subfamily)
LAWRFSGQETEAADLVQETYLRAYRTYSNFKPGTNSKAWLFTILRSVGLNRYRAVQRRPHLVSLEEHDERPGAPALAVDHEAEHEIRNEAESDWSSPEVGAALAGLPEEFRGVVLLVDVDQLSYEETAAVLGCPVGTVRSRLFRGRKHLFEALRDYAEGQGLVGKSEP